MKIKLIFIAFLVIFSGLIFYNLTGNMIRQEFIVSKVIDGDTIQLENGLKVRLLGINTPEKNMIYYEEAKEFLKKKIENRTIEIETNPENKIDKYDRVLAYVFLDGKFINKEILENGLGNLYYYEKDKHYSELKNAKNYAQTNNLGIWEKSENFGCLSLIELKYTEKKSCSNQEQLIINNKCARINITLKDNANHIYREEINQGIYIKNFSCIFNDDGDNLFIWDKKGLVFYYEYL